MATKIEIRDFTPYKWMRCPYCGSRFPLTEHQALNNLRFRCSICKRFNSGFCDREADGTLIGMKAKGE